MSETRKAMDGAQLMFIVTANMIGSGIIGLPANMAWAGAIRRKVRR